MNIFVKIKNSIYNPKYYSEVIEKPFSYSLKYFLGLSLLFALVFAIVLSVRFLPGINLFLKNSPGLANYFPQELAITFKDGKVSSNVQEPYFIKMPAELKNNDRLNSANIDINGNSLQTDAANFDNMFVVDTKDKFDIGAFNTYNTFSILNSDSFAYVGKNNQISIVPLSGAKNFILNRNIISGFINSIEPYFIIVYPVFVIGMFFGGFMFIIVKMIYLFFGALLIWAIAKAKGLNIGYKKSYKLGLSLMTSAIIIAGIIDIIYSQLNFAFLFSIILMISAFLNLNKADKTTVPVVPE